MHGITFFTLALAAAAAANADELYSADKEGYGRWAAKYNRHTKPTGGQLRAWMENRAFVSKHNADASNTWVAELNAYGDMTNEEFKEKILMKKAFHPTEGGEQHNLKKAPRLSDPAESFDWKGTGAVLPVQDQGFVGTCWAFSTTANIEGQVFQSTNTTMKLAEEYFVDCDGQADYDLNHADCSIFGGWPYLAYQFVTNSGGIPSEESYPYCAGTGECYPCMQGPEKLCGPPPYYCDRERDLLCKNFTPAAQVIDWRAVSTDESEILDDLVATGPLSILLDAQGLQYYKSGVWNGKSESRSHGLGCSSKNLDHAVLLTGYGVDASTGEKYWNVKNSWSESWGEDGYFRIARGEGMCGMNTAVTTAIM